MSDDSCLGGQARHDDSALQLASIEEQDYSVGSSGKSSRIDRDSAQQPQQTKRSDWTEGRIPLSPLRPFIVALTSFVDEEVECKCRNKGFDLVI